MCKAVSEGTWGESSCLRGSSLPEVCVCVCVRTCVCPQYVMAGVPREEAGEEVPQVLQGNPTLCPVGGRALP